MKTFLTKKQATYIADKFDIKPKSNVILGSYYDYQFKCGLYYTSKEDVINLLSGKRVCGTGVEYLLTFIEKEYPEIFNEINEISLNNQQ